MNAKSKPNKEYEKLYKNKDIGSSSPTPFLLYFLFSSSSQFGKCDNDNFVIAHTICNTTKFNIM